MLSIGDRVPADYRLVDSIKIMVDKSLLMGKIHGMYKVSIALSTSRHYDKNLLIMEQKNIIFMSILILSSSSRALVIVVENWVEFGKVHIQS